MSTEVGSKSLATRTAAAECISLYTRHFDPLSGPIGNGVGKRSIG